MRVGVVAAACAFAFTPLAAQDSTRTVQDSAVRVFLDCPDTFCDFDYYRTTGSPEALPGAPVQ